MSNLKFRKCRFIVQSVDNFILVNVEITDLEAIFSSALKLLQTNADIVATTFRKITVTIILGLLVALLMHMREN